MLAAPAMNIDPNKIYVATLKTAKGDIVIHLLADKAPVTVNNFIFLAKQGFYDNTTFHRVIAGNFAQGGDPSASGTGGPGHSLPDEIKPTTPRPKPPFLRQAQPGARPNRDPLLMYLPARAPP